MKLLIPIVSFLFLNSYNAQTLTFSNPDFLQAVLKKHPEIDLNKDKKIQQEEADKVKKLILTDQNLKDVQDVDKFKNIEDLAVNVNQIEKIKLNDLKYLVHLYCGQNQLKELEISNMPMLSTLVCAVNQLTEVTIKNCPNIVSINMLDNQIKSIDLLPFKKLEFFNAENNKLEQLNLSDNTELVQIMILDNNIKTLDITKNQKLKMTILYIDPSVNIIGTEEQMSKYTPREPLIEIIKN